MARTIEEIKDEMTSTFMANTTMKSLYNLDSNKTWAEQFSKVSIENLLVNIVSSSIYVLEKLFDAHLDEVESTISKRAHTLVWYRDKALEYEDGVALSDDTAEYDNSELTDEELASKLIVKKAACQVVEENYPKILFKIAKENGPLSTEELSRFTEYAKEISDAGLRIETRSVSPDILVLTISVWYDPLMVNQNGYLLDGGSGNTILKDAVDEYLADLQYNGTFYPQLLEQYLMTKEGIKMAKVSYAAAQDQSASKTVTTIDNYYQPYSGALAFSEESSQVTYINFNNTYRNV